MKAVVGLLACLPVKPRGSWNSMRSFPRITGIGFLRRTSGCRVECASDGDLLLLLSFQFRTSTTLVITTPLMAGDTLLLPPFTNISSVPKAAFEDGGSIRAGSFKSLHENKLLSK